MAQINLLFVDAYDSFSASITSLLRQIGNAKITTVKIDTDIPASYQCSLETFLSCFDCIVLGPGPGHPANKTDVGLFETVWTFAEQHQVPVFGICLGFQTLGLRYGLNIERLPLPCHGHPKQMHHSATDIFYNVGNIVATQYNSLGFNLTQSRSWMAATSLSSSFNFKLLHMESDGRRRASVTDIAAKATGLQLLAWNEDGYVMSIRHQSLPFWGVQFHPESCKSSKSARLLLQNWLQLVEPRKPHHLLPSLTCPTVTRARRSIKLQSSADQLLSYLRGLTKHTSAQLTYRETRRDVTRQQVADFCYSKSKLGECVMLESTRKGRYSIYGFPHETTWRLDLKQNTCLVQQLRATTSFHSIAPHEAMTVIEKLLANRKVMKGCPETPFWGGLAGFLSYELGLQFLDVDQISGKSPSNVPDLSLLWIDRSIVIDHETSSMYLQSILENDTWLDEIQNQLSSIQPTFEAPKSLNIAEILESTSISLPKRQQYVDNIQACQSELLAGNSYELCLTTETLVNTPAGPHNSFTLYNNIQRHNPVPYAAYLELGNTTILCSSPEKFLDWSREGVVDMIPMKGTVKKSPDMTYKKALAILSTPKESAENLMIADLIRHDLYTALDSDEATVEVVRLCDVVEHETVYQLVSHIRAQAPRDQSMSQEEAADQVIKLGCRALQCSLPPGSMTGAPKKRSCEILQELEQRSRGVYAGVIGYVDVGGAGSWNVCIRSAFSSRLEDWDGTQTWHIGAGGAITVLSDDEGEWQEMNTKLDSVLKGFRE